MLLDLEDLLLFLDGLRLDHQRRPAMGEGTALMREAVNAGLMPDLSKSGEFRQRVLEARDNGWIVWTIARNDYRGDDLLNARDFKLTDPGIRQARELKGFPRMLLVAKDLETDLHDRRWEGAAKELVEAEEQFRSRDWLHSVERSYAAMESGLKHALDEAGVAYGAKESLKALVKRASASGIIPSDYEALFGFLDSIRGPRLHGRGGNAVEIEIGPAEALLMVNHTRSPLLYLSQRPPSVTGPGRA